jgi:hypothetical protein
VLILPLLLVWWQSVVTSQLYRCVDWVFVVMDATHCIDLTYVNAHSVGRLLDGYFCALMQLGYREARILARI